MQILKASWGDGEWQSEPDERQWQDEVTGLPCLIVRSQTGALCGYVGVPHDHPAYGVSYDDVDVDVHGGLTFAGDEIHYQVTENVPDNVWWLGFDCSHFMDFSPAFKFIGYHQQGTSYRTIAYVTSECQSLAKQLKEGKLDDD